MAKHRSVRRGDALDDADVVVRGGELDSEVLRADAERYDSIYGLRGFRVRRPRVTIDELAQQPPLVRFEVLTLVRVGVLRAAGFA